MTKSKKSRAKLTKERTTINKIIHLIKDVLFDDKFLGRTGITQEEIARELAGARASDLTISLWIDKISPGCVHRPLRYLLRTKDGKDGCYILPVNNRIERIPDWKTKHVEGEDGVADLLHSLKFEKKLRERSRDLQPQEKLNLAIDSLLIGTGYSSTEAHGYLIGNGHDLIMQRGIELWTKRAGRHTAGHVALVEAATHGNVITLEQRTTLLKSMGVNPRLEKQA
jgi:hypothetical protein